MVFKCRGRKFLKWRKLSVFLSACTIRKFSLLPTSKHSFLFLLWGDLRGDRNLCLPMIINWALSATSSRRLPFIILSVLFSLENKFIANIFMTPGFWGRAGHRRPVRTLGFLCLWACAQGALWDPAQPHLQCVRAGALSLWFNHPLVSILTEKQKWKLLKDWTRGFSVE